MLIFKYSIEYFKDHILNKIYKDGIKIDIEDINFVLSVPANWDCTAEMFMREAAIKVNLCEKEKF